jgi:hypothetical protein
VNQPAPGSGDTGPTTDEDPPMTSTPRLIGTRTCLGCGQELAGQPINRTAVEDLPFVRCSECGRATPVLEYPVMSRWSGTLGAGLLCLQVLVSVTILFLTGLFGFAIADEICTDARHDFGNRVSAAWDASSPLGKDSTWEVSRVWWEEVADRTTEAILAEPDAGLARVSRIEVAGLLVMGIPMGVLWSGLFAGIRRSRLWIPPLLLWCIAMPWAWLFGLPPSGANISTDVIARGLVNIHVLSIVLLALVIGLEIGILFGRPIIRWLARTLLPPDRVRSLDFAWRVDGRR